MTNQEHREGLTAAIADLFHYLNENRASRPSREELLKAIKELVQAQRVRPGQLRPHLPLESLR